MLGRTSFRAARSARGQVQARTRFANPRFQSTASNASGGNSALVGGLTGGAAAFVAGYAWYHFSGTKSLVATSKQAQDYFEQAKQTVAEKTPEPHAAYGWLKDTVKSYAGFIPGASSYVDSAFDDLEKIRKDHGKEFDQVIGDAYRELQDLTKKEGVSATSAAAALQILQKHSKKLFELAGDAAGNLLENHPKLKEKIGGSYDQLKEMGDAYGPKAKEEVNRTWEQISGIVQKGVSAESAEEIKKLIQEKTEKLQKFGEEAWQKGRDESQQYLEKNPKLKKLIDDNAESLKKGNFKDLWGLIKDSASSGKTEEVEKFVQDKVEGAKNTDFASLGKWLDVIPGGSQVIPQLQSLRDIAQKKGSEAENVLKETLSELREVLEKRKEQVEKLAEEGKKESK
ncbi:unnamed protein product [Penicillium salamii]|uniref:Apolipoprotein/apolipophorin n=1 Tax=Penicillium salamii TaxID=1612424 RepID=A0A9W4JRQ4_9EURO|nr:unnamed protein product [Penicillium salamii]CAG8025150.1 unnamed protein product [Penicillium salamii]CAG8060232.1 unnamed protein product [Penicillium salamii]CAG8082935.1 unnamed protein product [Penicillium salamii]CAG8184666.1 unnamed protein product [Penicillium salamii]